MEKITFSDKVSERSKATIILIGVTLKSQIINTSME